MALPRFVRAQARRAIEKPKLMRRDQFAALPLPGRRVLFLGDSITEQGLWQEWFPDLPVLNRGIGGETVQEVAARLDTAIDAPLAISLLVGTNDLTGFGRSTRPGDIAADFEDLLAGITARAPEAPLVVTAVMPRQKGYAPHVQELNRRYRDQVDRRGATWIDLRSQLADPTGALRPELTADRLHLNGAGYRIWVDALRPHLTAAARNDG